MKLMDGGMYKALFTWLQSLLNMARRIMEALRSFFRTSIPKQAPPEQADVDPRTRDIAFRREIEYVENKGHKATTFPPSLDEFPPTANSIPATDADEADVLATLPSSRLATSGSAIEPTTVWNGENGPELPKSYQTTTLQAMPCDMRRVFLYWEIANADLEDMESIEGRVFTHEAIPVLRIRSSRALEQELEIDLGKGCIYLTLHEGGSYTFEIAFKHSLMRSYTLVRSNRITMPTNHPSRLIYEEGADYSSTPSSGANGLSNASKIGSSKIGPQEWVNASGEPQSFSSHFPSKSTG